MKALPYLFLAAALRVVSASADPMVLTPPGPVRRGEPAFVTLAPLEAGRIAADYTLSIRYTDGSSSPRYRGFGAATTVVTLTGGHDVPSVGPLASAGRETSVFFLVSVPVDASLGEATMVVSGLNGIAVAGARFPVADRAFSTEDLRLDAALTSLRVDPDPRKTEQAQRYIALLATVDPAAVYLDSGFMKPVETERRTSLFGLRRRYLYSDGGVDVTMHNGIDYGCPAGTPVLAAGRGRVVMAEDRIVTGKTIVLEHLPGAFTIYMHLDTLAVAEGSVVNRGAFLGTVGKTGLATGPHLHWEFRVMGIPCDPESLIGLDKSPSFRRMVPAIEGG